MKPKIAVVDYEAGNLKSITKALLKLGADAKITKNAREIEAADAVVLPGVGSYARMRGMKGIEAAVKKAAQEKPFLGICLGMQLLFEESEESKEKGFGLMKGKLEKLKGKVKIPHMGWNNLKIVDRKNPLLKGISEEDYFYFVHSYAVLKSREEIARCEYGNGFVAAVARGKMFGVQFHPEKSGEKGLRILQNFLDMIE
ncbi:Pyridoxal 5'-phosphate synthase subunit PdxT [Candidatus Gugararchaeum adminiculabundum]|nr:Pyridoxal 5'-phosphate synthase subunit PdxT [Candidatus Gugararchaeum adminiculabundum]